MRFYGLVALAFVMAFAGVSWASRGFPVGQDVVVLLFGEPSVTPEQRNENLREAAGVYNLNPCDPAARENLQKIIRFHMAANVTRLNPSQAERMDAIIDALQIAGFTSEDLPNLIEQIAACSPGQAAR